MIYAILSILISFTIAFGRQISVFGRIESGLWFFSKFEVKRLSFSIISIAFGILSLISSTIEATTIIILSFSFAFLCFSYFFDMRYFFPEINTVIRANAKDININGATKVIGLTVGKSSVAYPLQEAVIPRHIIIDQIEDKQVLICFCALCQSALAFNTKVDDKDLSFRVAGVWRRNMIIYDTLTYSLWQQATGECIYGSLKGKHLKLLSGVNLTWEEWKTKHPKTEFAIECKEARIGYLSREKMNELINKATNHITVPGFTKLIGLSKRETIFGINYNGISRAYPKSLLKEMRNFEDNYHGKILNLEYNQSADYLFAKEKETKKDVIVEKHWWLGWKEFHPETEIWKK